MANDWLNVADITPRIAYTATGGQTAFAVPFVFFDTASLKVYKNTVLLTLATHYTISGPADFPTGTVTLLTGATVGDAIVIVRQIAIEQTTHIPPSGPLDIPAVNFQFSKLIAIDQQLNDEVVFSVRGAVTDTVPMTRLPSAAARALQYLAFDALGNPIAAAPGGASTPVSSVMAPVVAASTLQIARDTLGVPYALNALTVTCATNHTVVVGDYGKTLDVTVKMVTVTFGVASGFSVTHYNIVSNSSGRRVNVAVDGHTTFKLYPKQMAFIVNSSGGWVVERQGRYVTNFVNFTFYVDHANGSDTLNDGLAAGVGNAFATIQKAINTIESDIDCAGFGTRIQIANETFTENNVVHTFRITGYHVIYIVGDAATPGNCIWQIGAGSVGLTCRDWSGVILDGVRMVSTGAGSTGVSASQHGIIDLWNIEFGAFAAGTPIETTNGGSVGYVVGGTSKFLGNCAQLWVVSAGANLLITGVTINIPAPITFTIALQMTGGSCILSGITFTGAGAGAGSTGGKYGISGNGLLISNAVVLPGASAGTTSTGGQVL